MKIKLYCLCGAAWIGSVSPDNKAKELTDFFWSMHDGEGHGACDSRTAGRARRKAEAKSAAERRRA